MLAVEAEQLRGKVLLMNRMRFNIYMDKYMDKYPADLANLEGIIIGSIWKLMLIAIKRQ